MTRNITLNPISVGATSVLRNLFFDLGRATIQQESYPELNAFVNMMKKNPSVKVEIAGHTDNVGDDNFNLRLSLLRANAVRSYLVSKGIVASRMGTKGYGETRPLVSNDDEIGGREINRRVELKILSK
jgi:outer membrane protein OmpA-like peptidoglycan-associated protein